MISSHLFSPRAHRNQKSAFTLIELLVVIAIIAILAAILFPVFARARENARRSSCQSNLKQIGLAFMQYSQDYDEAYPGAMNAGIMTSSTDYNMGWDLMIAPYLGIKVDPSSSPLIMQCPSDAAARNYNNNARSYSMAGKFDWEDGQGSDPAQAYMVGVFHASPGYFQGRRLSEIPVPAQTLMVVEHPNFDNRWADVGGVTCQSPMEQRVYAWTPFTVKDPMHFDGSNYLFADGHVKWMRGENTVGTGDVWWNAKGMWTLAEND